jgi:hypothetical protein
MVSSNILAFHCKARGKARAKRSIKGDPTLQRCQELPSAGAASHFRMVQAATLIRNSLMAPRTSVSCGELSAATA